MRLDNRLKEDELYIEETYNTNHIFKTEKERQRKYQEWLNEEKKKNTSVGYMPNRKISNSEAI